MKPYEIVRDIFIVGGPEITDSRDGCVYLLNLGELVLIDSGAGWSVDKIIDHVKRLGFDPLNLSTILLTHCHIDHIGGAPDIRKKYGSKIYIHKLDAPPLEDGDPVLTAANWYQTTFYPTPVDVKLNSPEEILRIGEKRSFASIPRVIHQAPYLYTSIGMANGSYSARTFTVLCLRNLDRISMTGINRRKHYSTLMPTSSVRATLGYTRQRKR